MEYIEELEAAFELEEYLYHFVFRRYCLGVMVLRPEITTVDDLVSIAHTLDYIVSIDFVPITQFKPS